MKHHVLIGQTDYTVLVMLRSDAGAPATGKAHTDIDIAYSRVETDNDVTTADVSPSNLSALTDAHTDWGWEEVSSTDHPGVYRLDIADAVFASGAWSAVVSVTGTGLDPAHLEFVLVSYNQQDGVRLGLTALPNAAAEAAGGLYTRGSGAGQINQPANGLIDGNVERWNNTSVPAEHTAGYPIVTIKDGTGTGELDTSGGQLALAPTIDDIWDEQIGDGTLTARQVMRICAAVLAGKLSGAATTTVTIRNVADSADVVISTVDSNGNRSAVTVTP